MLLKLCTALILLIGSVCCGSNAQNFKSFKLPSGKEIKVTGVGKMDFPNSDPALVMNYLTDIPIEDKTGLRKEVDEIWGVFQKKRGECQPKGWRHPRDPRRRSWLGQER